MISYFGDSYPIFRAWTITIITIIITTITIIVITVIIITVIIIVVIVTTSETRCVVTAARLLLSDRGDHIAQCSSIIVIIITIIANINQK